MRNKVAILGEQKKVTATATEQPKVSPSYGLLGLCVCFFIRMNLEKCVFSTNFLQHWVILKSRPFLLRKRPLLNEIFNP